ncbi:protein amnionless [Sphaeramia orbicularis]|uniref:Protein amnionless n=1 Tax=Sphaeramia orbicularis TaxID=375764 RepID=A0A673AKX8_9TELE|nr:protein amnionless [Sphaeramia orbicularis]
MLKTPDMLLLFCLVGAANALYKQWIPDTNYENKTNWDRGAVPCGNDVVQFSAQRKVSVFVESAHAVREMKLPLDGEFILNSRAGFYVLSGQDPDCGAGVTTKFKNSDSLVWYNPALWQAAATLDDLQQKNFLFSVHEESVPCKHDDVVFKASSSFRVDTSSSEKEIPVKSVSVLGKKFDSSDGTEFNEYLQSHTGRLQFHGSSDVAPGMSACDDPSGCICGNSANLPRICNTVTCTPSTCKKPLRPSGHCCDVCGAILTVHYDSGFNLQTYRQRIQHRFLTQYTSVQLGMSKVFQSQRLLNIIPLWTSAEIQVVILDGEGSSQAEALVQDLMKDINSQGSILGITGAEVQTSSGNNSKQTNTGMVIGAVFGVLIMLSLIVTIVVLVRKGVVQMPSISMFHTSSDIGELGGPIDRGFDNPMFDKPSLMPEVPSLYGTEVTNSISMRQTGVHFVNPVYDEHETDFNV